MSTTVAATNAMLQFNANESMKRLEQMMKTLTINDCDNPSAVNMNVDKVESDEICISYNIQKAYYLSLNRPILKILIEYALLKDDDQIWSDYKEIVDDISEPDSDSHSSFDTSSDSASDDSDRKSESDEGNKTNKKNAKKKKKRNRKEKKKMKEAKAKLTSIAIDSFSEYDEFKWYAEEIKVTKKKRKSDRKFVISENIKSDKTYMLRMKILNQSGWSLYPSELPVVKTPKTSSKILKAKEMAKLLKMVHGKLRDKYKWKLIFRSSKDGFTGTQFHAKCDHKKQTVCIVQTDTNNVFGGYMGIPWQPQTSSYGVDPSAFVFLIRSSAKYKPAVFGIQHQQCMYCIIQMNT